MRIDTLVKAREDPRGIPGRILDAAEEVFAELGFAGASTREIAKRAHVPLGAIHYYWSSKQGLKDAVFQRHIERLRDTIIRSVSPGGDPEEIFDNILDGFFELLVANRNLTRFIHRELIELPELPHEGSTDPIDRMFHELTDFAVKVGGEMGFAITPGAIAIGSVAFIAAIASENTQRQLLGATVFESRKVREQVRADLRKMARALVRAEKK